RLHRLVFLAVHASRFPFHSGSRSGMTAPKSDLPIPEPAPSSGSDLTLIRRYRIGDESAATSLYLRYAKRLRSLAKEYCTGPIARRIDADDVVQSVFRTFF